MALFGSDPVNGTLTYSANANVINTSSVLPAGSYTLSAVFTPADSTRYKGATATVPLVVQKANTVVAISASISAVFIGNAVVLSALATLPNGAPGGSLTFLDGSSVLGTIPLNGGAASLSVSSLSIGSHALTALYSGDPNFYGTLPPILSESVQDLFQRL